MNRPLFFDMCGYSVLALAGMVGSAAIIMKGFGL